MRLEATVPEAPPPPFETRPWRASGNNRPFETRSWRSSGNRPEAPSPGNPTTPGFDPEGVDDRILGRSAERLF